MKSLWLDDSSIDRRSALSGDKETDTVIVGGGLAGMLCAYLLNRRGVKTILLEAKQAGAGVTGNTTAKITAQHALIYSKIEKQYGFSVAADYFKANQEAVEMYRQLAAQIPCDFEDKTAYVYSKNDRQKLEDEAELYRRMKIEPLWLEHPPIPLETVGALGMGGQAQFHPIKFLKGIMADLEVYENSFVTDIRPGEVVTDQGTVRAKRIILATHFPMVNLPGLYFLKLYQQRSYVLALSGANDPDGMYIDEQENGLSFRMQGEYLLLGGGGHRTGKQGGNWTELRNFAKAAYPAAHEQYAWATQDCISLDGIPYIGRHHESNREMYVATGFNKWGMTSSMAAARLLTELITEGKSRYEHLFYPSRPLLNAQLFSNMGQAAVNLLSFGKRCPHMGCALKWNPQEHSWDCPCHGSRFDQQGRLIHNPAKRGIHLDE